MELWSRNQQSFGGTSKHIIHRLQRLLIDYLTDYS